MLFIPQCYRDGYSEENCSVNVFVKHTWIVKKKIIYTFTFDTFGKNKKRREILNETIKIKRKQKYSLNDLYIVTVHTCI